MSHLRRVVAGAEGVTDAEGKAWLTLFHELAGSVRGLYVKVVGWRLRAMRVDQLPAGYRGRGVKMAVVDSGAAATHQDLRDQISRNPVVSCVPPADYAVWDGTSMAAPHVMGVAALILAHHPDFQARFRDRNAARVERLFDILRTTAPPRVEQRVRSDPFD